MAPAVGLEPTTDRLTADCSTTELRWNNKHCLHPFLKKCKYFFHFFYFFYNNLFLFIFLVSFSQNSYY